MTNAHVPDFLVELIDFVVIYDSEFLRILALVALAILAGMILDPLIPVLLPIILPTLIAYDIDLVHFGVLMVIAVVIGQVTPPMAIALIIAGRIAKCGPDPRYEGKRAVFPWYCRIPVVRDRCTLGGNMAAQLHAKLATSLWPQKGL